MRDDWIHRDAVPCPADASDAFDAAVDTVVAAVGAQVELLGFGEALHGGEEILQLRNRLFQRLVTVYGYRAIAIESSFARGRVVNQYIAGRGPTRYADVQETGFSHGFGQVTANRELIEWMRDYNAATDDGNELRFYGFDLPALTAGVASPSQVLRFALNYLTAIDAVRGGEHGRRIDTLLGDDSRWENPAAMADPSQSVGLSSDAVALRIATEDLLTELRTRQPELVACSSAEPYREAVQHTVVARELLNFHAALAGQSETRDYGRALGIRDAAMADNLAYIVDRERGRGRVFAFAHNFHLKRGQAAWPGFAQWWPAGAYLDATLAARYAVIGTAVGVSEENGIGPPEAGSLEARLLATPGPIRFVPTHRGTGRQTAELTAELTGLPTRSGSTKNRSYFPLEPHSLAEYDWLAVLDCVTYTRGARPLPS